MAPLRVRELGDAVEGAATRESGRLGAHCVVKARDWHGAARVELLPTLRGGLKHPQVVQQRARAEAPARAAGNHKPAALRQLGYCVTLAPARPQVCRLGNHLRV